MSSNSPYFFRLSSWACLLFFAFFSFIAVAPAWSAPADLGPLELTALDEALSQRGLTLDPAPLGKIVGQIHVVNHQVFSARDGVFVVANHLHRSTREDIIRREVLLSPGDVFSPELLDESARNLRDPEFSTLVVAVPIKSATPGVVDLLIVTRDVWSLRFNTDFEFREGRLIHLSASLSENNLLGLRKRAAWALSLGQGSFWTGPTYYDSNVVGSRVTFSAAAGAFFSRETGRHEGQSASVSAAYPLFSLASRVGGSFGLSYSDSIARDYLGTTLRREDLPETPDNDALPRMYRYRSFGVSAGGVRSFGHRILVQRLSFGHRVGVQRPMFTGDFPDDPLIRAAFARAVFPRSELVSAPYLGWGLFTPRYRTYRDFDTFDLREDVRLGPTMNLGLSAATVALGSDRDFVGMSGDLSYSADLGNGLQRVSVGWSGRAQDNDVVDQGYSAGMFLGSPLLLNSLRVVASAGVGFLKNSRPSSLVSVGGDSGLRAYVIGEFRGKAQAQTHLEVRSRALTVFSLRAGALLFWDMGHAAPTLSALTPFHDTGLGLRVLIPQLNPYVIRLDWSLALQATPFTRAGLPGRFSLGFRQVF